MGVTVAVERKTFLLRLFISPSVSLIDSSENFQSHKLFGQTSAFGVAQTNNLYLVSGLDEGRVRESQQDHQTRCVSTLTSCPRCDLWSVSSRNRWQRLLAVTDVKECEWHSGDRRQEREARGENSCASEQGL